MWRADTAHDGDEDHDAVEEDDGERRPGGDDARSATDADDQVIIRSSDPRQVQQEVVDGNPK
jgi:hypothetical protein